MKEAFRRHLLLWVILASLLVVAAIVVPVIWGNRQVEPAQFTGDNLDEAIKLELELNQIASDFTAPVDIVSTGLEGDQRLFIVEQGGRVRILENGVTKDGQFLNIANKVINEGEQGLLGMAFSPDLAHIYVNYVRPAGSGRETVIARYDVSREQTEANSLSEKIIMTIDQPYANHNGGDLVFGPDGYLYIALGDGGSGGDPANNAQNKSTLLGKILRIDVDSGEPYSIPDDNPFKDEPGSRDEIWSYGWRNPWRLSFDSAGNLWVADVGQNKFEEINFQPAGQGGLNYGWRCYEANGEFNLSSACPGRDDLAFPVATYEHSGIGCSGSVTGGYVYEGQQYSELKDYYFAADYCNGRIYRLPTNQEGAKLEVALETELGISTFGVDSAGELYLADRNDGGIYQVILTPQ